jgi:hypothetical protein
MNALYEKLNGCSSKPVALSLVDPYAEQYISKSRSIPTVSDLYDPANQDLDYPQLIKKCFEVKINISEKQIHQIEKDTRKQAKGSGFFKHRAGRIGASMSGAVTHIAILPNHLKHS